ncbi:MAG TPA: DUF1343 domain-containing protein [Chthoniobacteraceae bacterium]|jgi:uncharacterized protein YbbC (DUF1343 family)|nr:DUF1343 domain-containing protein [Chthoniobacteraceae bacterium]
MPKVRTGLDVLVAQDFAPLRGLRVGLVTHPAAVDSQLRHAIELFAAAPKVTLAAIFGPEHGLLGQAQDLISVAVAESKPLVQSAVHSLYGATFESLKPTAEQLAGLDALVIDMQDVGSRYYTFQATMRYCLEVALPLGMRVFVLDRPNPLGGEVVEGPALQKGFESFVGAHDLAIRHGLTIGEMAMLYQQELDLDMGELRVVACEGWKRSQYFDETGLPWVLPSPNMPTLETAIVYPGQCLIEGTNLSEGRGTTRPFELCGAPWIDAAKLAQRMNAEKLPGVRFRAAWFRPTFQKHAGKDCGGVQLHVTDRTTFQPVRTSLALLSAMREMSGAHFAWRTEVYEFVRDPIAIDLLFGSARERIHLEANRPWRDVAKTWTAEEAAFTHRRHTALLYD